MMTLKIDSVFREMNCEKMYCSRSHEGYFKVIRLKTGLKID